MKGSQLGSNDRQKKSRRHFSASLLEMPKEK
jgi:hypothetical protein